MEKNLSEGKLLLLSRDEMEAYAKEEPFYREMSRMMDEEHIPDSRAEMLADGVVGSLELEATRNHKWIHDTVHFYLGKDQLLFVDLEPDTMVASKRVAAVLEGDDKLTPIGVFLKLLDSIIKHDMKHLQQIEMKCFDIEESLSNESDDQNPMQDVAAYRKILLQKNFRYQQLTDLSDTLVENPYDFFTEREEIRFQSFGSKVNHLAQYAQMLRDYLVQLREMYQQKLDVRQNKTMKMLTIVTTLFFPLTLIAGWYGMNFEKMPELSTPYGYFILIGICLVIIVFEIVFFKKKKFF